MKQIMLLAGALVVSGGVAMADGDIDIGARLDGGRVQTWAADHDLGVYLSPERVFKGELAFNAALNVVEGDEPGWFFDPGNVFAGSRVGFNVRAAARAWDPAGASNAPGANFQSIAGVTFTIGNSLLGQVSTPSADPASPIAGPSIVVPSAGIDFHYPFEMNGNVTGIYLLELEAWSNLAGAATSEPFWVVLNYGLSEAEHERAEEYVANFVVPAPGAAGVLVLGGLVASRRRRS